MSSKLAAAISLALVAALGGCKGGTKTQDSKETLDKLAALEGQVQEKDKYIQDLRNRNAELERGSVAAPTGDWVFTIEGDALTIKSKPSGGSGAGSIDDKTATAMSQQFLDLVSKSRGPIQKCYELALKKSQALQGRTVNLTLNASFSAAGAFNRVNFSPELPEAFDTCLRGVASKWKMPQGPQSMTFQASVKLTPT